MKTLPSRYSPKICLNSLREQTAPGRISTVEPGSRWPSSENQGRTSLWPCSTISDPNKFCCWVSHCNLNLSVLHSDVEGIPECRWKSHQDYSLYAFRKLTSVSSPTALDSTALPGSDSSWFVRSTNVSNFMVGCKQTTFMEFVNHKTHLKRWNSINHQHHVVSKTDSVTHFRRTWTWAAVPSSGNQLWQLSKT